MDRWLRDGAFEGETHIVTGAAQGIGRCVARGLAAHGAQVTLVDVDRAPLDTAAEALASAGMRVRAAVVDVTERNAVDQLASSNDRRNPVALLLGPRAQGSVEIQLFVRHEDGAIELPGGHPQVVGPILIGAR